MSAIRAGRAYVELFADPTKLEQGLAAGAKKLENFSKAVGAVGAGMLKLGGAITAPLLGAVAVFAKSGDELQKMSIRAGISVEGLSELRFAAEQSGASLEGLNGVLSRMRRTLGEAAAGGKTQTDNLARLGLSAQQLQQLKPEQQLGLIADRLNALTSEEERAAVAAQVLGRSYEQIDPLLRAGSAGIDQLRDQARRLGLTVSTESAEAAAKFSDEMNILRRIMAMTTFEIGGALVPVLTNFVQWAQEAGQKTVAWIRDNKELIVTLFKWSGGMAVVGAGLLALAKIITTVATLARGAAVAFGAMRVAMTFLVAHPAIAALTLIAAGATAIAVAFARARQETRDFANELRTMLDAEDRLRKIDQDKFARLSELASKQRLTNAEMAEAREIANSLRARYGELGIEIDAITGAITGLASAWETLIDVQRREALERTEEAMEKSRKKIAELTAEFDGLVSRRTFPLASAEETQRMLDEALAAIQKEQEALRTLQERQQTLRGRGGPTPTGGGEPTGGGTGGGAVDPAIEEMERRISQLRIRQREDEFDRERALINMRYEHELRQAGATQAQIDALKALSLQELEARFAETGERIVAIEIAHELEVAALRKRLTEEEVRRRQQIHQADLSEGRRIEELRLRTLHEGLDLERAMIDLREKHALEDAAALGHNLDLVRERYDLERRILSIREQESQTSAKTAEHLSSAGTFAAQNVAQLLGRFDAPRTQIADPKDRANEETAKNTKDTAEAVKDLAVLFRRGSVHFT